MYKLNIALDISLATDEEAIEEAIDLLDCWFGGQIRLAKNALKISLIREGDRSAANLLSIKDTSGHYRNQKIDLSEIIK